MIDTSTWRQRFGIGLMVLFLIGTVAACSNGDSPTGPSDPGDVITPPDDLGTVVLEWDAPTTDADGSGPLTDLVGYRVCYGARSTQLNNCANVGNVTRTELQLPAGTYFFAVRAVDTWGNASEFSNVLEVTVEAPGTAAPSDAAEEEPATVAETDHLRATLSARSVDGR